MIQFLSDVLSGAVGAVLELIDNIIELLSAILNLLTSFKVFDMDWLSEAFYTPVKLLIGTEASYDTSIAYKVYEVLIPVGAAFLMIYFAMYLQDLLLSDQYDMESLLKTILYLILALLIMDNGYEFLIKCFDVICDPASGITHDIVESLKNDFFSGISSNALFSSITLEDLFPSEFNDASDLISFLGSLTNLIPSILTAVFFPILLGVFLQLTVDVARYMRAIKIAVYMAFSPIAFANIFGGTMLSSKSFKHFKKILSLFLQAPVIIILIAVACSCISELPSRYGLLVKLFFTWFLIRRAIKISEETTEAIVGL